MSEKVSVRLFRHNWKYLLVLLEKQEDINSRLIGDRIKYAIEQEDIREVKREQQAQSAEALGSIR